MDQTVRDGDWKTTGKAIASLVEGESDAVAKMATIACELFHAFERFHWVGFYRLVEPQLLKIGPYQGEHGCLVIPFSRGVCGACAMQEKTLIVPDVEEFPGHIACAASTRSEIVLPVFDNGELIAVLDIDSDYADAFNQNDAEQLTAILENAFGPQQAG